MPIAEVIETEKNQVDVKSTVESGRKKIVINNVDSDNNNDEDNVSDVPILCNWVPVKCYFDGSFGKNYMKPLPCRHSGCTKFAHQAYQDNWVAINPVTPFNVVYTLCHEHHPQYCCFIEELNEDNENLADDVKDNNKQAVVSLQGLTR